MAVRKLVCITCPMGCEMTVTTNGDEFVSAEGNTCPRGAAYAKAETTNPVRTITTTVYAKNGEVVPVKSASPLPKKKMMRYVDIIKSVTVENNIKIGDVVVENIDGTGVNIVSAKNL